MMRNKISIFLMVLSLFWLSCSQNDIIADISETGEFAPNIYFVPLSPIAFPGSNLELEIEYWSKGAEDFPYIALWESVNQTQELTFNLADVTYTFDNDFAPEVPDPVEKITFQHSFINWTPDRTSYVLKTGYEVDENLKRTILRNNNTTKAEIVAELNTEFVEEIYDNLSINLTQEQLETILVTVHEEVSSTIFSTYFSSGIKTTEGLAAIKQHLVNIGLSNLMGSSYSLTKINRIIIHFRVRNPQGAESESAYRGFNVN